MVRAMGRVIADGDWVDGTSNVFSLGAPDQDEDARSSELLTPPTWWPTNVVVEQSHRCA
jgi:hypothetical protein